MSYTPSYPQRINFENDPSTATPLNQTNLNKMDNAIYKHDLALSAQDERISDLESEDKVTSFKGRTGVVTPADDDYTIAQIKATGSEGQIPALNAQGKLAMVTPNKAGHDIVDKVGNVMTTRENLQFVGAVSVTDDSTNNKTIVNVTGGGGGGGGHVIEDNDGTDMPQEDNLQFVGVYTEDDATNDRTKVNIVREMTSAQMQSLTPAQKKGFIRTIDEPDNPISDFVSRETIRTGVVLERYGKYRRLVMRNVSPTSSNGLMMTLSEEDKPHQFSTNIVLGVLPQSTGSFLYPCYANVNPTTGDIQAYYFDSGTTTDLSAPTTMKIYGDIDWLVD